jgi:DNA-nicking Smr family endonuclease
MRRLSVEEQQLWDRLAQTVNPMHARPVLRPQPFSGAPRAAVEAPVVARPKGRVPETRPLVPPPKPPAPVIANTLDGAWDRRLGNGRAAPDYVIDLHGHTLDSAWRYLDHGLERALRQQARLVLLITGKPRSAERVGDDRRGIIRAKIADWLTSSRFARQIAAVRNAHPRHGGTGALYLVLRRH